MIGRKWIIWLSIAFIGYAFFSSQYAELKKNAPGEASVKDVARNAISSIATTQTGEEFLSKTFKTDGPLVKTVPTGNQAQATGLIVFDSVIGEGAKVECGQSVTLHYTISQADEDQKKIDSTHDMNHPVTFVVGRKKVIRGLELGVIGMQKGGIRKMTIPPYLAYDDPIFATKMVPSFSMIKADVELLDVMPAAADAPAANCK